MSTSKGSINRSRPQKHQNRSAFKNDLHDKSDKTKFLNSLQVSGVCKRCKDKIDWKIKYKKYKPLTAPKKCVRCEGKTVKHAYHVICHSCARKDDVCAKCCKKEETVVLPEENPAANDAQLQELLKLLPERKRRTLIRFINKQATNSNTTDTIGQEDDELHKKIENLKLCVKNNEFSDDDDDESASDDFHSSDDE